MDTQTIPTQPQEEIVLNSTPLPSRLVQESKKTVESKFPPKKYLMIGGAVLVLFVLSLVGFILTQPKDSDTPVSPPVVIKKAPTADETTSTPSGMTFPSTAPGTSDDPIEELNGIDVGSIEADLQNIQNEAAQLQ